MKPPSQPRKIQLTCYYLIMRWLPLPVYHSASAMKLFLLLLSLYVSSSHCNLTGGGFGAAYNWVSWTDAKPTALSQKKPIMLLLHKTWCGACKRLKPVVSASKEMIALSEQFVMVNAEDEEEPSQDGTFSLDGGYIPRVIFLDPSGVVRPEFSNKARPDKYSYFYTSPAEILVSMKEVLETLGAKQEL